MAELGSRPATLDDVDLVHRELMDVIDKSEHYNDRFKAHEKTRLTKGFLRSLIAIDPYHVFLMTRDGVPGGAMVSGPEYGALFRYWSWVFPAHRESRLGMLGMRVFDEHWDNNRFHKAFTFVRPENQVALLLLRRYGYSQTCILRNHIFGQDYAVVERHYTKAVEGYDSGMGMGRAGRLVARIGALFGR
jgi:hypothetical protein